MGENMVAITANNQDRFGVILFILAAVLLIYSFISGIVAKTRRQNLMKIARMIEMAHNGQKITKEMYYEEENELEENVPW